MPNIAILDVVIPNEVGGDGKRGYRPKNQPLLPPTYRLNQIKTKNINVEKTVHTKV